MKARELAQELKRRRDRAAELVEERKQLGRMIQDLESEMDAMIEQAASDQEVLPNLTGAGGSLPALPPLPPKKRSKGRKAQNVDATITPHDPEGVAT